MAYCTTADVKTFAQGDISDTSQDTLYADLILSATAIIDGYTGRTFEAADNTSRFFDALGDHIDGRSLFLWQEGVPTDLCAIESITNGDGTTVTTSQYTTRPKGQTPFHEIRLLTSANIDWTYSDDWEDAIEISGKWAYSVTAPQRIKHACIRLAAWLHRQKDTMVDVSNPVLTANGQMIMPSRLPGDVRELLRPYVRAF